MTTTLVPIKLRRHTRYLRFITTRRLPFCKKYRPFGGIFGFFRKTITPEDVTTRCRRFRPVEGRWRRWRRRRCDSCGNERRTDGYGRPVDGSERDGRLTNGQLGTRERVPNGRNASIGPTDDERFDARTRPVVQRSGGRSLNSRTARTRVSTIERFGKSRPAPMRYIDEPTGVRWLQKGCLPLQWYTGINLWYPWGMAINTYPARNF